MSIDVASRALAVSVRIRTPRWLSEYCRAGDHWSYDAFVATPVKPFEIIRQLMAEPSEVVPAVRIGSMFGSTGSMYGGMKMRPAFEPCWWMSLLICGSHGVYSESTV